MPIETKEHEVAGHQVSVTVLPAGLGLNLGRRLLKVAGPALVEGIGGGPGALLSADWSAVSKALRELVGRLGEPEAEALVKDLCRGVSVDGQDAHKAFDSVFAGEYALLARVMALVIEENFKLPLSSWGAAVRGALEEARKTVEKPRARPRSSGNARVAT